MSYREFLLVSNGAYGDDYGATLASRDGGPKDPPAESAVVGVGFLPVEDVRWLRDAQPRFAGMMAEATYIGESTPAVVDGDEAPGWAPFADGLLIATEKARGTTVLIPFDGLAEWQLWNTHKETSVAYVSFRSFLEYEVAMREPVTAVSEAEELIVRAKAGDHRSMMRLSRVVNPGAIPLLVAALEDPGFLWPADGLGRIGTPEALAALMNLNPDVARHAFVLAGNEQAREVLVARGDYDSLFTLDDPRAFDLAAQAIAKWQADADRPPWPLFTAVTIVGYSGDQRYVPLLLPLLPHADLGFLAACALVDLGAAEGARHLAQLADTPGFPYRSAAVAHVERFIRLRRS